MIEPNILAFQNAALLEALADPALRHLTTIAALAEHLGKDKSNLRKTMALLVEADLLLADPLQHGLTVNGHAQLAAFKRAQHGGERRKSRGRWPLDKLQRNPANRTIDPDAVLGLADTIVSAGDILQPLTLSPPDALGVRTIWIGERRWIAATRLLQLGQLPAALVEGVPFVEREANAGEAAVITLIENTARQDLTPWEDAQQLRRAAEAHPDWSASELARRIGRAREGDRGGVRDVQQKLKIAREATPEAVARYEADPAAPRAWEDLRDSVTQPKPAAAPTRQELEEKRLGLTEGSYSHLTLLNPRLGESGTPDLQIELAYLAGTGWIHATSIQVGSSGSGYGLSFSLNHGAAHPTRDAALQAARRELYKQCERLSAGPSYIAWLNQLGGDRFEPVRRPSAPRTTETIAPTTSGGRGHRPELNSDALRALSELAHWHKHAPRERHQNGHVEIRIAAWRSPAFVQLKDAAVIGIMAQGAESLHARVTNLGREMLSRKGAVQIDRYSVAWIRDVAGENMPSSTPKPVVAPEGQPLVSVLAGLARREEDDRAADRHGFSGLQLIADERHRQVEAEGYDRQHDDDHIGGELALAAATYALSAAFTVDPPLEETGWQFFWPWDEGSLKPRSATEDLIRAGALIVAELERLHRAEAAR